MPGSPCPNASGECVTDDCEATDSTIWYGKKGAKYCKHCYDTIHKKKKRTRLVVEEEEEDNLAGDLLVEIISIYGARHVPTLEPPPHRPMLPSHNRSRPVCMCGAAGSARSPRT